MEEKVSFSVMHYWAIIVGLALIAVGLFTGYHELMTNTITGSNAAYFLGVSTFVSAAGGYVLSYARD
jgi:hypothetical protein